MSTVTINRCVITTLIHSHLKEMKPSIGPTARIGAQNMVGVNSRHEQAVIKVINPNGLSIFMVLTEVQIRVSDLDPHGYSLPVSLF